MRKMPSQGLVENIANASKGGLLLLVLTLIEDFTPDQKKDIVRTTIARLIGRYLCGSLIQLRSYGHYARASSELIFDRPYIYRQ